MLEEAILGLPQEYRAVLMLRDIEELSTAEPASSLSISEENVKVRLFRGRAMVRKNLFGRRLFGQEHISVHGRAVRSSGRARV